MRRGETLGRLDTDFNNPRFQQLRQSLISGVWPTKTIQQVSTALLSGFAAGPQDQARDGAIGIPHLRPLNISENGDLSLEGTKRVPISAVAENDLCKNGEVLFNNTNSAEWVGKSTVFRLDEDCACSNHITRIQCSDEIIPDFLAEMLNLLRSVGYFATLSTYFNNQAGVNTATLAAVSIPFPPLEIQHCLVAELATARIERDRAATEAEKLLASIDKYVLAELAILPETDPRRVFAVRLTDVKLRLDADYQNPYFQRLRRAIDQSNHTVRQLGDLAIFMRSGFAAGRQDQAQGGEAAVPHLRPLNLNAWGELSIAETKSVPASRVKEEDHVTKGEVLFNNTNSAEWVGKSTVFELETPCACSNHMTRILLKPGVEPHFIAALLNAFRGIGYFSTLSTFFNNQAGINTSTLASLRVPVPDLETQKRIAEEVVRRKSEARRLQNHAETIWREARERFEQQLLQGG